jgi:hypothetical protein
MGILKQMRTRTALAVLGAVIGIGWALVATMGIRSNAAVYAQVVFPPLGAVIGGLAGYIIGVVMERALPGYTLRRSAKS